MREARIKGTRAVAGWGGYAVYALTAIFFGCFLLWPIWQTVAGAFVDSTGAFTGEYFAEIFRNRFYLEGLSNAFLLAVAGSLFSLVIALPLAFLAGRFVFPGKRLFSVLILAPMILPPFVGAIGMKQILGRMGALNAVLDATGIRPLQHAIDWLAHGRFWGCAAMISLHLYPILYLNIVAALANIDPAMEEAAANLGCTGLRKFWKITLPLIMPGLFAGGTIVFIWAFTELGVPLLFDYDRVASVQIFHGIREIAGNPLPYALVVVTLIGAAMLYLASKLLFGRNSFAMLPKASTASSERRPGFMAGLACAGVFAVVCGVSLLPHLGVILISFSRDWYGTILPQGWTLGHYEAALGHNLTVPSIINSLKYASLSTLIDLVLGVAIACVVVRTELPGRHLLDGVAMLPLAVPGLVLAFGYISMSQEGRFFSFLNPTRNPLYLLVIAYAIRRLPYVVRAAAAGLAQTSVTLEEAARNLGATPFRALRKITLPLISANILAGGLLAFSFAMLEVSDSLILAQKQQDFPITKAIYELFNLLGNGRAVASALGVWAMLFLGLTLLAATGLLGKRMGALFRA